METEKKTGTSDETTEGTANRPKVEKKRPTKPRAREKWVPKLVVLFRHGPAEAMSDEKPEEERSLTTSGHDRTKRAARGLARIVTRPDVLYSSPLLRALQTALWVTKAYRGKVKVRTTDVLLPGSSPEEIRKLIDESDGKTIVLIGHEPTMTATMAQLLGLEAPIQTDLRKAGCVGIRLEKQGRGTLEWMLAPRMLRRMN